MKLLKGCSHFANIHQAGDGRLLRGSKATTSDSVQCVKKSVEVLVALSLAKAGRFYALGIKDTQRPLAGL